jgi:pyruvate dehydrogenase E2 component (dihydrolipoyllysine-residue acetyltransferase)
MPVSVTMPRLGESVSEGTVTRWLKKEGERVEADEPLLEVSTDKVDTEIPAPASGVLSAIRVGEDETVEVGVELAVIDEPGAAAGTAAPAQAEPADQGAPAEQQTPWEQPDVAAAEQPPGQPSGEPAQPAAEQEQAPPPPAQRAAEQAPPRQPPPPQQPAQWQQPTPPQPRQVDGRPSPATSRPSDAQPAGAARPEGRGPEEELGGAYVTPLVRKLAAERNVDLSAVTGTGVGGRIRKQDVLEAARARQVEAAPAAAEAEPVPAAAPARSAAAQPAPRVAPSPLRGTTEKMSRLRTVIAHRMVESLQVSAQLTTVVEVDVTRLARLRERAKEDFQRREGVRLSFLPFFAIASVEALKQHSKVNASIDTEAGTITYHDAEHLGVAVDTERGLLVPVIHNAGDLNLGGMARKIADLAERTRANKVSPDELGGGTFTLTNTGSRGALFDTPIINQPQVAILGTGSVVKRPAVVDDPDLGEIVAVRSMAYLALTYDHRIIDGADAARFLLTIKERLEAGGFEADLGLS